MFPPLQAEQVRTQGRHIGGGHRCYQWFPEVLSETGIRVHQVHSIWTPTDAFARQAADTRACSITGRPPVSKAALDLHRQTDQLPGGSSPGAAVLRQGDVAYVTPRLSRRF